ncbi:hypothetical protein ABZW51_29090, partial [Streptomyces cellulosae]
SRHGSDRDPDRRAHPGGDRGGAAQFASVAAGAPAPLIATALLSSYGSSTPIALYVIAASLLTVVAILAAKETRHRDLTEVSPEMEDGTDTPVSVDKAEGARAL